MDFSPDYVGCNAAGLVRYVQPKGTHCMRSDLRKLFLTLEDDNRYTTTNYGKHYFLTLPSA